MHWTTENNSKLISLKITEIISEISGYKCDIMAVIKYASKEEIISLLEDGRIKILGESRVQDAIARWEKDNDFKRFRNTIKLHFIGHLQTNKVKHAVKIFDSIDSVDSIELAKEIDARAQKNYKKIPIAIQVKINDRDTQYGFEVSEFDTALKEISMLKKLSVRGIMAIAPLTQDGKEISSAFKKARKLYDNYFKSEKNKDGFKNILSMGMSSDWKIAANEGSNLIRIGTYLFHH